MNGIVAGALMALSFVQQTDTTFALDGAEYLDVESLGGSIVVEVWDEDRVRVRAEHSTRTYVEIDRGRRGISVESEARRGPANIVDYRITVPRRLALQLEAQPFGNVFRRFVSIIGVDGDRRDDDDLVTASDSTDEHRAGPGVDEDLRQTGSLEIEVPDFRVLVRAGMGQAHHKHRHYEKSAHC